MNKQVRVGLGVIVMKDNKVLVGRRKGSHGAGCWAFPGGHQDFGETWEECAQRELEEETGIKIKLKHINGREYAFVTNNIMPNWDKHYCTIFVLADWIEGSVELKEPNSCEGWYWMTWQELLELKQPNGQDAKHWLPHTELKQTGREIGLLLTK